jgi:uncharacterized OB-fold protein
MSSLSPLASEHWRGAARGELCVPHCLDCDNLWFPPSRQCPRCLSDKIDWRVVSGRGRVTGWCIMHRQYFETLDLALPYAVILVQLDEGPFLYSNFVDPATVPEVGQSVEAMFIAVETDGSVVRFRVVTESS